MTTKTKSNVSTSQRSAAKNSVKAVKMSKNAQSDATAIESDVTQKSERALRSTATKLLREKIKPIALECIASEAENFKTQMSVLQVLNHINALERMQSCDEWQLRDLDAKQAKHERYHTVNFALQKLVKSGVIKSEQIMKGKSKRTVFSNNTQR